MKRSIPVKIASFIIGIVLLMASVPVEAAEPSMADYTAFPVFMTGQVAPNILVMLDNSGSMNYPAYGTWPGTAGGIVADDPYHCGTFEVGVNNKMDDAEEDYYNAPKSVHSNGDLDLGYIVWTTPEGPGSVKTYVAIRFQNLPVPRGATITKAYIEFMSDTKSISLPSETKFIFKGEATDHAETFEDVEGGISKRNTTTAEAIWSDVPGWDRGNLYQSPDLKDIVQEIVDRDGWNPGQSMAFIISGEGKRVARARDQRKEIGKTPGGCFQESRGQALSNIKRISHEWREGW